MLYIDGNSFNIGNLIKTFKQKVDLTRDYSV